MPLFLEAQEEARSLIAADPELEEPAHRPMAEEVRRLFDRVTEQGLN